MKKKFSRLLIALGVFFVGIAIVIFLVLRPQEHITILSEEQAVELLEDMTLREKICQMLVVQPEAMTRGTVTKADAIINFAMEVYPVGGFIFKAANMESKEQVAELLDDLQSYSRLPLFFACDEEGGMVSRLMRTVGTTYIGPMFDYRAEGVEIAYQNAYTIASDMSALGFNLDFAPVADVWSNPENTVISSRAYSDDFEQAAELVASAVEGFHAGGVATTLKHFPGHGDTSQDSHYSSAYITKSLEELREEELLPFIYGIEAGSDMVMLGHLIISDLADEPILFSYEIVTGLLREELGFTGVVITDSLDMAAVTEYYSMEEIVVRSINAGVDMLLCPGSVPRTVDAIEKAVKDGRISEERIDESALRILKAKIW